MPVSNYIKKLIIFLIPAICLVSFLILLYGLANEKNYNSVLMEYVSGRVVGDNDIFEEKIRRLREFTHQTVHPVAGEYNRLDTVGVEKLSFGIGWCDQVSRVFMQLAKPRGITTRLLFLLNKDGSSPHSIAEAYDGERWVLVDAPYNLEFLNKNKEFASMEDIKEDFSIVLKNPHVKMLALHNPWWNNKENLTMYYREPRYIVTRNGAKISVFDYLPSFLRNAFIYVFQEMYFIKVRKDFKSDNEFLYFKARNYHLTGRVEKAKDLYSEILNKDGNELLTDRTSFFLAVLLEDNNRDNEAIAVLTDLINNPKNSNWLPYAYSMRAKLYNKIGQKDKAKMDEAKFVSSPDAYL